MGFLTYVDQMNPSERPSLRTSMSRQAFFGGIGGAAVMVTGTAGALGDPHAALASGASGNLNLVINPSFELSPAGTSPVGWRMSFV